MLGRLVCRGRLVDVCEVRLRVRDVRLHELGVAERAGVLELRRRRVEFLARCGDFGLRAVLRRVVVLLESVAVGILVLLNLQLRLRAKVRLRRLELDARLPSGGNLRLEIGVRCVESRLDVRLELRERLVAEVEFRRGKPRGRHLELHQFGPVRHAERLERLRARVGEERLVLRRQARELVELGRLRLESVEFGNRRLDIGHLRRVEAVQLGRRHRVDVGVRTEHLHRLRHFGLVLERVSRLCEASLRLADLPVAEAALDLGVDARVPVEGHLRADFGLDLVQLRLGRVLGVGGLHHVNALTRDVEPGRFFGTQLGVERLGLLIHGDARGGHLHGAADRAGDHACHGGLALRGGLVEDRLLHREVLRKAHLAHRVALLLRDLDEERHQLVEVEHHGLDGRIGVDRARELFKRRGERVVYLLDLLLGEVEPRVLHKFLAERVNRGGIHRRGELQVVGNLHRDGRLHSVDGRRERDAARVCHALRALRLRRVAYRVQQRLPAYGVRVCVDVDAHVKVPFGFLPLTPSVRGCWRSRCSCL